MRLRRVPAAPVAIIITVGVVYMAEATKLSGNLTLSRVQPSFILPSWAEVGEGTERGFVLLFPLTLSNAVLVTAVLSRELLPEAIGRTDERNLALSTRPQTCCCHPSEACRCATEPVASKRSIGSVLAPRLMRALRSLSPRV
jgi:hypothetical protein